MLNMLHNKHLKTFIKTLEKIQLVEKEEYTPFEKLFKKKVFFSISNENISRSLLSLSVLFYAKDLSRQVPKIFLLFKFIIINFIKFIKFIKSFSRLGIVLKTIYWKVFQKRKLFHTVILSQRVEGHIQHTGERKKSTILMPNNLNVIFFFS